MTESKRKSKEIFKLAELLPGYDQYMTAKIQGLCRDGFEVSTPNIIAIAKGEKEDASPAVQVRAHANLGKVALGNNKVIVLENRQWLPIIMKVTASVVDDREKYEFWLSRVFAALELHPHPDNA